jgi:hypothetical protein
MLMSDLAQYLEEIVAPTVKDFDANPTSRRHAFIACVVVCHGVDYLAFPDDPRTLRQQFAHQSPAFKIVNDVGHAFKHVVQGRVSDPRMKASEVISRPPAYWNRSGAWNLSRWNDAVGGVTLDGERNIDLLDAVKGAIEFLWAQIKNPDLKRAMPAPSAQ